jgi:hypothetical protein
MGPHHLAVELSDAGDALTSQLGHRDQVAHCEFRELLTLRCSDFDANAGTLTVTA